jgi:hypothetical protein
MASSTAHVANFYVGYIAVSKCKNYEALISSFYQWCNNHTKLDKNSFRDSISVKNGQDRIG